MLQFKNFNFTEMELLYNLEKSTAQAQTIYSLQRI